MDQTPFISICIPAYRRPDYLKRLLNSIAIQKYPDYEVVVTDDSPDELVKEICDFYTSKIQQLRYVRNPVPLGTPANWNAAIKLAKGKWIKLMHDDDWFADEMALQEFAKVALKEESVFIFSAYINTYEDRKNDKVIMPEKYRLRMALKEPAILVAKNFIGPPSVTLHRNDGRFFYDLQLKWLVDIDMYRRRIEKDSFKYITKPLIKVGISDTQVTTYTKNMGNVEIPEHFHFLHKMRIEKLKNILVYDYNWRFMRNFEITDINCIRKYGYNGNVPAVLNAIIDTQKKISPVLLRNGFISKLLMILHFIKHKKLIK